MHLGLLVLLGTSVASQVDFDFAWRQLGPTPDPGAPGPLKFSFGAPDSWHLWFNATRDACNADDVPDQSMTAFRRDDGTVVAYIGDNDVSKDGTIAGGFYRSYGPSVNQLTRDCSAPVIKGAVGNGPSVFPHSVWLMATWTEDGNTIYGFVHDEYHASPTDIEMCPGGVGKANHTHCWYTAVLAVISTDGGTTFEYMTTGENPRGIALAPPVGYTPTFTKPQGFPNNHLVSGPDGYIYMILSCGEGAHLPSEEFPSGGKCVYRTADISNAGSWRGWNGSSWSVASTDPYASPAPPEAGHLPAVVGSGLVGSGGVVYLESAKVFVMMGSKLVVNPVKGKRPIVQVYYTTSTNVTDWTTARNAGSLGCATYPRLMDAASVSRNFDHISANSSTVYFQFSTGQSPAVKGTLRRSGVAVPVLIELELD